MQAIRGMARMCHVTNGALFGKKFNRGLEKYAMLMYNNCVAEIAYIGLSPNGKALDSDSSISRFESLQPSSAAGIWLLFFCLCMAVCFSFLIRRLPAHILCNCHSLQNPLTSGITVKGYTNPACKYPLSHGNCSQGYTKLAVSCPLIARMAAEWYTGPARKYTLDHENGSPGYTRLAVLCPLSARMAAKWYTRPACKYTLDHENGSPEYTRLAALCPLSG